MFNFLVKLICFISGLTMIYVPVHMIMSDFSKLNDGLFLVPLSLGLYLFYLLYLLNKTVNHKMEFTSILKEENTQLNHNEFITISLSEFHSFIKYTLLKPSIPDMWRGRVFHLFEVITGLMIKLDMSIKDIHRFDNLDVFVKYTYLISDNDHQIQYLNRLPGYGTDNYIANQHFTYLMIQINLEVKEFMALMDNDMILYHPDRYYDNDIIKYSWMDHHLFSIIKNDFKDGFSIVNMIKKVVSISDDNKKEQYHTYLHFLYQNIYQYKSLYDKI